MNTKQYRLSRRSFLQAGLVLGGTAGLPALTFAAPAADIRTGLETSDLIYLTPLKSDGSYSQCQAEVWFVSDNVNIFVVTARDAWRAKAIKQGLNRTQIWVGDLGNWQNTNGRYRSLPSTQAVGSLVDDVNEHKRVLELFSSKYRLEWFVWGPRFRTGLNDGSRIMLRYIPA